MGLNILIKFLKVLTTLVVAATGFIYAMEQFGNIF